MATLNELINLRLKNGFIQLLSGSQRSSSKLCSNTESRRASLGFLKMQLIAVVAQEVQ
jgi:hypothetical protein